MEAEYLDSIYPYTEEYYFDLQNLECESLKECLKSRYELAEKNKSWTCNEMSLLWKTNKKEKLST